MKKCGERMPQERQSQIQVKMAFKTAIKIKDLGKRRVESASAEETEIVNSGEWITLNASRIVYDIDTELDTNAEISKFENDDKTEIYGICERDKSGVLIPKWTIKLHLDTTSTSDLQTFANLVRLSKSKGVKQITGVTPASSILNYVNYYDDYFQDQSKSGSAVNSGIYCRMGPLKVEDNADKKYANVTIVLYETS